MIQLRRSLRVVSTTSVVRDLVVFLALVVLARIACCARLLARTLGIDVFLSSSPSDVLTSPQHQHIWLRRIAMKDGPKLGRLQATTGPNQGAKRVRSTWARFHEPLLTCSEEPHNRFDRRQSNSIFHSILHFTCAWHPTSLPLYMLLFQTVTRLSITGSPCTISTMVTDCRHGNTHLNSVSGAGLIS